MEKQHSDGMTINERLYHFGLLDDFDAAAKSGNVSAMEQVLLKARYSVAQAKETAETVASNAKHYGY